MAGYSCVLCLSTENVQKEISSLMHSSKTKIKLTYSTPMSPITSVVEYLLLLLLWPFS